MMSSRRQINTIYGGNVSWNAGFDYSAALNRLPEKKLIETLYRRAGLSLSDDLRRLAKAPRISEEAPALKAITEQQYFGNLSIPVISMQGIGDQISVPAAADALEKGVKAAGKSNLLRLTYTATAGHCTFSVSETAAAVDVMKQRLETGKWPDTSPTAMNALAQSIVTGAPARFIDFRPDPFVRFLTPGEFARRANAVGSNGK
jgi:hypothetical protein